MMLYKYHNFTRLSNGMTVYNEDNNKSRYNIEVLIKPTFINIENDDD